MPMLYFEVGGRGGTSALIHWETLGVDSLAESIVGHEGEMICKWLREIDSSMGAKLAQGAHHAAKKAIQICRGGKFLTYCAASVRSGTRLCRSRLNVQGKLRRAGMICTRVKDRHAQIHLSGR
jgi:hypothetical protein